MCRLDIESPALELLLKDICFIYIQCNKSSPTWAIWLYVSPSIADSSFRFDEKQERCQIAANSDEAERVAFRHFFRF